MNPELFNKFNSYMVAEEGWPADILEKPALHALTLSRETGAGSITVAQLVTEILEENQGHGPLRPWAIFERNLVAKVLEDHLLPEAIERYLPEEAVNRMSDFSEELFGLHPSSWTLVQKTNQTILKLAAKGNVILIGRGAHLVTAKLRHVFHVRLVAPLEFRIGHIAEYCQMPRKDAVEYVRKEDAAKKSYLMRNFDSEAQANLHFDLVVNTGRLGFKNAAELIAEAIVQKPMPLEVLQPVG